MSSEKNTNPLHDWPGTKKRILVKATTLQVLAALESGVIHQKDFFVPKRELYLLKRKDPYSNGFTLRAQPTDT